MKRVLFVVTLLADSGILQFAAEEKLNIISDKGVVVMKLGQKKPVYCVSQEPGLTWLDPQGKPVGPRGPSRHVHVEDIAGTLILLFDDPRLSDNGTWTCKTRDMERTVDIFVVEEAHFQPTPSLESPMEGEEVTLTCAAEGVPRPRLNWFRNGNLMSPTSNPGKMGVWEGRLVIQRVHRADAGPYECRARQNNAVWNHTATYVIRVLVKHKPFMRSGRSQKLYVLYDHVRIVRCSASAYPKPSYKWSRKTHKGEKYVPHYSGDVFTAKDGSYSELSIRVNGQDDLGDYVCYAFNTHGRNKTVFTLVKGQKPDPLRWVQFNSSSRDALVFDMRCGNCSALGSQSSGRNMREVGLRFELAPQEKVGQYRRIPNVYWETDRDHIISVDRPVNETEKYVTVGNLSKQTTYVVRVARLNEAGASDFIELHTQFTTTGAVSHTVSHVALSVCVAVCLVLR